MKEKEIKDLAWNTFKQTGDIHTFMEFKQVEDIEKSGTQIKLGNIQNVGEIQNGNNQNERNNYFRK